MKNICQRAREGVDSYGLNISLYDPVIIEIAARAGYDFVRLDCEHMLFGLNQVAEMVRTAKLLGIPIQARVTNLSHASALLDCGVSAVMLPHVSNAQKALDAVQALKFAPLGERGMTSSARVLNFGEKKLSEYAKTANDEVSIIVQIEDKEGLENIDEILAVEGIDMVATGRNDLAQALGVPGENQHPDVLAAEDMVISKAVAYGKIPTLLVKNKKRVQQLREQGVHCFSIARDDLSLYNTLKNTIEKMQEEG